MEADKATRNPRSSLISNDDGLTEAGPFDRWLYNMPTRHSQTPFGVGMNDRSSADSRWEQWVP